MTIEDFRRMAPEDQQRAIRAVLAVDGARERMRPTGDRTLTQALETELLYQRRLIKNAASVRTDAKSVRHSKSAAKRDRSKGAKPMASGGTASFTRGTPWRVTVEDQKSIDPSAEWVTADVKKLRKIDRTLLQKNAQS
jgi:hypothetical protein